MARISICYFLISLSFCVFVQVSLVESSKKTCIVDKDCSDEEICNEDLTCEKANSCKKDSQCTGDKVCIENICRLCNMNENCPDDKICYGKKCVLSLDSQCVTSKECQFDARCINNYCKLPAWNGPCATSQDCPKDQICRYDKCSEWTGIPFSAIVVLWFIGIAVVVSIIIIIVKVARGRGKKRIVPPLQGNAIVTTDNCSVGYATTSPSGPVYPSTVYQHPQPVTNEYANLSNVTNFPYGAPSSNLPPPYPEEDVDSHYSVPTPQPPYNPYYGR